MHRAGIELATDGSKAYDIDKYSKPKYYSKFLLKAFWQTEKVGK